MQNQPYNAYNAYPPPTAGYTPQNTVASAQPGRAGGAPHNGTPASQPAGSLATGHFGAHHVYAYPTTFLFQDKTIYTGDLRKGTTVRNPDGSIAFSTKDAILTLRNKEVVYDALGRPIASLHKKTISLHGTWQIFRGDSVSSKDHVADIKPGLVDIAGKTVKITLAGGGEAEFVIKGNFLARSFQFLRNNQVIAECRRHGQFSNIMNYISGEDTFTLTVQPGFDTALLVLATLVIDDILDSGH